MNRLLPLLALFLLPIADSAVSQAAELKPITLALNWKPDPEFGGFYDAVLSGEYKKAGLDVKLVPGGAGQPTIQMVNAGQVPFAVISGDELILARGNGAETVALFAVYQDSPVGLMVHEETGVKSLAELLKREDLTLAIASGQPFYTHIDKKYGIKPKTVPYSGGITVFLNDKKFATQCFVTSEPLAARKAGAKVRSFLIAESGYNPYSEVVVTTAKYARENPETVKKFVEATRKGWEAYLKDSKRANREMHRLNPAMDFETYEESAKAQMPIVQNAFTKKAGLGAMTQARWDELAQQLFDLKVTKKKVDCSGCLWK